LPGRSGYRGTNLFDHFSVGRTWLFLRTHSGSSILVENASAGRTLVLGAIYPGDGCLHVDSPGKLVVSGGTSFVCGTRDDHRVRIRGVFDLI
jgi:hypothetical protein